MILTIAKKEMKELFRDGKMKTFLVLLIGLSIFSGWIGFDHYQSVKAEHEQAQQRDRLVWENQGEKNPHSAAHYGIYAFKQMHPLSFVDAGIDHYEGIAIFMEAHVRNHSEFARAQDETALARFGHLSLGFVLLYLLPLFVLLAGFNSFSREKESGTLKMMIGQGVAPWNILLGKWMGLFTPGALFLLLILAAAGVLIAVTGDFSGFHLGSLAMMGLVYLLYLIVFVNITLLVSLLAKNENQALVLLAAIWILAVLIAPNISASIANHTYPYPSSQQYEDQLAIDRRDGFEGYEPWSIASVQLREQTLLEYGVNSVDELPFNYRGFAFQKSEEHEAVLYEYHFNKLREIQENQEDVYRSMAVLSPFLPARFLSKAIARTDFHSHWHFSDKAEEYRLVYNAVLNEDLTERAAPGDRGYQASQDLWKSVPEFQYSHLSNSEVIVSNSSHVAILLGWGVVSFILLLITGKTPKL